jgi:hypothetical protein
MKRQTLNGVIPNAPAEPGGEGPYVGLQRRCSDQDNPRTSRARANPINAAAGAGASYGPSWTRRARPFGMTMLNVVWLRAKSSSLKAL